MKKYDVIAFDLDGTLSDPARGQLTGFEYSFKKHGIAYPSRDYLRRYIGPPIHKEWQEHYSLSPEKVVAMVETYREYYNVYGWRENDLYDGVREMLEELHSVGKKIILATSKPEGIAKKILRLFDIDGYFDFIGGATEGTDRHFKADVLRYSLNSVGARFDSAILVGDRKYDAEGAIECGIDSLGVLWGHGTPEELSAAGFSVVVKTPGEALQYLIH